MKSTHLSLQDKRLKFMTQEKEIKLITLYCDYLAIRKRIWFQFRNHELPFLSYFRDRVSRNPLTTVTHKGMRYTYYKGKPLMISSLKPIIHV